MYFLENLKRRLKISRRRQKDSSVQVMDGVHHPALIWCALRLVIGCVRVCVCVCGTSDNIHDLYRTSPQAKYKQLTRASFNPTDNVLRGPPAYFVCSASKTDDSNDSPARHAGGEVRGSGGERDWRAWKWEEWKSPGELREVGSTSINLGLNSVCLTNIGSGSSFSDWKKTKNMAATWGAEISA